MDGAWISYAFLCCLVISAAPLRDDACMLQASSWDAMRIAVYTANIGGYDEVRHKYIAQVPEGIDAFYFLDVKSMRNNEKALQEWRQQGWNISTYSQIDGTQFVNGPRLTGKQIKFKPPGWLVDCYDWLIYQDANVMINLAEMESFLRLRKKDALVLLDWCHEYPMCCGEGKGMKCFNESTRYYMKEAPKRIPDPWTCL